jgi:hypothetical protein
MRNCYLSFRIIGSGRSIGVDSRLQYVSREEISRNEYGTYTEHGDTLDPHRLTDILSDLSYFRLDWRFARERQLTVST